MDGQEVRAHGDAGLGQALGQLGAVHAVIDAHHVHKPAHAGGVGIQEGGVHTAHFLQAFLVPGGDAFAFLQQFFQAAHLHHAQRGAQFVQTVVVAQIGVLQPGISGGAALIAQRLHQAAAGVVVGDHHTAFAGGDLLVRVKGEHAVIGQHAGPAVFIFCAQRFAGILDHLEAVLAGGFVQRVVISGLAKHVHRQQRFQGRMRLSAAARQPFLRGLSAGSQILSGGAHQGRVDIAGQRIDIHKYGGGALEEQDVGGGNEAEGGGDNQITGFDSSGAHT